MSKPVRYIGRNGPYLRVLSDFVFYHNTWCLACQSSWGLMKILLIRVLSFFLHFDYRCARIRQSQCCRWQFRRCWFGSSLFSVNLSDELHAKKSNFVPTGGAGCGDLRSDGVGGAKAKGSFGRADAETRALPLGPIHNQGQELVSVFFFHSCFRPLYLLRWRGGGYLHLVKSYASTRMRLRRTAALRWFLLSCVGAWRCQVVGVTKAWVRIHKYMHTYMHTSRSGV